jgi:hypothetical protein
MWLHLLLHRKSKELELTDPEGEPEGGRDGEPKATIRGPERARRKQGEDMVALTLWWKEEADVAGFVLELAPLLLLRQRRKSRMKPPACLCWSTP